MNTIYLRMFLVTYCKWIHLFIHFNPGAPRLFLNMSFQPQLFDFCTTMPLASSSINVWQQDIARRISRFRFKNLFCKYLLPSLCYHELWKHWARPSTQKSLAYKTLSQSNPLPFADSQHSQEDQPCRHSAPQLQMYDKLNPWIHSSEVLHQLGQHGCKLTEVKQKWPCPALNPLDTSVQNAQELPLHGHVWHTLQAWHSKRDSIVCGHLVEHSPCILYTPTIWHTCQWGYYLQRDQTHNCFAQSDHEYACLLQVQLYWHRH